MRKKSINKDTIYDKLGIIEDFDLYKLMTYYLKKQKMFYSKQKIFWKNVTKMQYKYRKTLFLEPGATYVFFRW